MKLYLAIFAAYYVTIAALSTGVFPAAAAGSTDVSQFHMTKANKSKLLSDFMTYFDKHRLNW